MPYIHGSEDKVTEQTWIQTDGPSFESNRKVTSGESIITSLVLFFSFLFVLWIFITSRLFSPWCVKEREYSTVISSEASLVSIENRSLQRSYCTFSTFFWLSVYRVHIPSSRTACTLIDWLDRPFEKHWVVVVMAMWSISLLLRDVEYCKAWSLSHQSPWQCGFFQQRLYSTLAERISWTNSWSSLN